MILCDRYEATCAQYIGEICRFLLQSPVSPDEKKHKLRSVGSSIKCRFFNVTFFKFKYFTENTYFFIFRLSIGRIEEELNNIEYISG